MPQTILDYRTDAGEGLETRRTQRLMQNMAGSGVPELPVAILR